jgi:PQQ-dependent dehydrogenase (methanol/ethanol family)
MKYLRLAGLAFSVALLASCAPDYVNFPNVHYDLASTRSSPVKDITKDNIKDLGVVWSVDFKALDPSIANGNQNYPIAVDGVLYVTTGKSHVFAFDAATGKVLWHFKPDSGVDDFAKISPIVANRGVAVAEGKVFALLIDNRVVALDAKTGAVEKIVAIKDLYPGETDEITGANGYYETTAPVYFDGKIFIGSSGSDNGVRGFVMALKASDLSPAWDHPFWTVPPKGQDWLKDSHYQGGGGVWMPVTIDAESGLVYFAVGNPAPDFFGENRPGANPYTDSVVAVEAKTGKYVWDGQEIPHDLWDYDAAASPMLIKAKIGGVDKKIVVQGGKGGLWFAWDAATGAVVYDGVPFAKIDHPKPTPEGVLVYPGILGGENYAPESYDPATGYVLIPGIEYPALIKSATHQDKLDKSFGYGALIFGTTMAATPPDIVPYGTVTAIDVTTGKIVYQNKTDNMMRGGFTNTSSGLAFYGELDGIYRAIDIKSGSTVWEWQLDGDNVGGAPAIYQVKGKSYVALTSGGTKPKLFVFALGGDKTQGQPVQ